MTNISKLSLPDHPICHYILVIPVVSLNKNKINSITHLCYTFSRCKYPDTERVEVRVGHKPLCKNLHFAFVKTTQLLQMTCKNSLTATAKPSKLNHL